MADKPGGKPGAGSHGSRKGSKTQASTGRQGGTKPAGGQRKGGTGAKAGKAGK